MPAASYQPPYLKYSSNNLQIQAVLKKYRISHGKLNESVASGALLSTGAEAIENSPTSGVDSILQVNWEKTAESRVQNGQRVASYVQRMRNTNLKAASNAVELNMETAGHLSLGAHCKKSVSGKVTPANQNPSGWFSLYFSTSPALSGNWSQEIFLGTINSISSTGAFTFEFDIDSDTYGSLVISGKKYFRVVFTEINIWMGSGYTSFDWSSEVIELDFNKPACNSINSVTFLIAGANVGTTCDLEGSNNGSEPTFEINLAAPALADQTIRVSTDNDKLGWISGGPNAASNFFDITIPTGQTKGAISWFLGTKNVVTTGKSFHVVATLMQPDGSVGNYGLGKVCLLK